MIEGFTKTFISGFDSRTGNTLGIQKFGMTLPDPSLSVYCRNF